MILSLDHQTYNQVNNNNEFIIRTLSLVNNNSDNMILQAVKLLLEQLGYHYKIKKSYNFHYIEIPKLGYLKVIRYSDSLRYVV